MKMLQLSKSTFYFFNPLQEMPFHINSLASNSFVFEFYNNLEKTMAISWLLLLDNGCSERWLGKQQCCIVSRQLTDLHNNTSCPASLLFHNRIVHMSIDPFWSLEFSCNLHILQQLKKIAMKHWWCLIRYYTLNWM